MFENFTEVAVHVVTNAITSSVHEQEATVHPKHLLYALIENETATKDLLQARGLSLTNLCENLDTDRKPHGADLEPIVCSEKLKHCFNVAQELRIKLKQSNVTSTHLFIAVLQCGDPVIEDILARFGLDPNEIYKSAYSQVQLAERLSKPWSREKLLEHLVTLASRQKDWVVEFREIMEQQGISMAEIQSKLDS